MRPLDELSTPRLEPRDIPSPNPVCLGRHQTRLALLHCTARRAPHSTGQLGVPGPHRISTATGTILINDEVAVFILENCFKRGGWQRCIRSHVVRVFGPPYAISFVCCDNQIPQTLFTEFQHGSALSTNIETGRPPSRTRNILTIGLLQDNVAHRVRSKFELTEHGNDEFKSCTAGLEPDSQRTILCMTRLPSVLWNRNWQFPAGLDVNVSPLVNISLPAMVSRFFGGWGICPMH